MEKLINIKEAARLLGRSTHSVRKLAKAGAIQYTQHGSRGRLMFRESWLASHMSRGPLEERARPGELKILSWDDLLPPS